MISGLAALSLVTVGVTTSQSFTVENVGGADLTVTSTVINGDPDFQIAAGGGAFVLAPGATEVIDVEFTPASPGVKTADLEIARELRVGEGEFYTLLPPRDDIHYVTTVSDRASVSIHLLANDTACVWRHRYDPAEGTVSPFRSRYSNTPCPPEDAEVAGA